MGESRSRENHIIIQHQSSAVASWTERFITTLLWMYLLGTAVFIASILFNIDAEWKQVLVLVLYIDETEVKEIITKIGILFILFFIIQWVWGKYNYLRFGKLRRRKAPISTTMGDLIQAFPIDKEDILYFQTEKIITVIEEYRIKRN